LKINLHLLLAKLYKKAKTVQKILYKIFFKARSFHIAFVYRFAYALPFYFLFALPEE